MSDISGILNENLTPSQLVAATDEAAEIMCLACAGSGKSRTLAFRIARLIAGGAPPESIVAFTFTNKAAESIKRRVAGALTAFELDPTMVGAMYVGTIHSYCKNVLEEMDACYRQFDELDDNRLKLYLMSRYPQLGLYRLRRRVDAGYFKTIGETAGAWKVLNDEMIEIDDVAVYDDLVGETLRMLRESLERDEYIDFSMMIRLTVEALANENEDALRVVEPLRHLMVDEYQDVNPAQEALIQALHQRSKTLFVVGDDDQSIYAWRGADVQNIMSFTDRYPNASEHTLSRNFRSTDAIVSAADTFIHAELGASRTTKNPQAAYNSSPRDFRTLHFDDREAEAEWVADRIEALLGTAYEERDGDGIVRAVRGLTPADFAILMPSTKQPEQTGDARHAAYTRALDARNIPYSLSDGGSIFDRLQVQALREAFGLLRNGTPGRRAARELFNEFVVPVYPHADFNVFAQVLGRWGRLIHSPTSGARRRVYPQQLVHDLLYAFGIADSDFDEGVMQNIGMFSRIMQDVETVYLSIDSAQRFGEVLNFLENVAEAGYDSGGTGEILHRPDAVTVSTVHKAKGLEFPCVFVADAQRGRFPRRRSSYRGWLPEEVLSDALDRGAYQGTREEQARLFYTAVTRAERYLYVTGCTLLPGGTQRNPRSPFVQRLTHEEIEEHSDGLPNELTSHPRQRRIDDTAVPTSFSDIRYYLRCPRDYQFRKLFGFSPPIMEMFGFGNTVHSAVGRMHQSYENGAPTREEAEQIARAIFHLKHVPPSNDPENNPGPYERAQDKAGEIAGNYAESYAEDFDRLRQVEVRFEIPVEQAVITGSIDLLLMVDPDGSVVDASVVDFKTMEGGEEPTVNADLDWTELALQVQLYARAADEVLNEPARTGSVHLLGDNQRVDVPVTDEAVEAAVTNVEWAVARILEEDFPMRPAPKKCKECDFRELCPQQYEEFNSDEMPPRIHVPGPEMDRRARAFSEVEGPAIN